MRVTMQAKADGTAAQIVAENARSPELHELELERERLSAMPEIVREMVKPAEKIESIKVNHVSGLSSGSSGDNGGSSESTSPVNHAVKAIMDMAVGLPALKKLGDQISGAIDPSDKKDD